MTWSILPELSAWHAAQLVVGGFGPMHPEVATALAPLVKRIGAEKIDHQVAALGSSDTSSLKDSFELYEAIQSIVPVADEMPTRIGPLKMQWEARGPGMVACLRRSILGPAAASSTDAQPVQILPVYPWAGGFAQPLPASGAVMVEAVLTDAAGDIPEVVRLAWGHAQLLSHHAFATNKIACVDSVHALTTIMPTLSAAEHVQLAVCDDATVAQAIRSWMKGEPNESTVQTLIAWWEEWSRQIEAGAADWPMAVSAIGA